MVSLTRYVPWTVIQNNFADSITYVTTVLGLLRAGIAAFVISPRCTPVAAAALLSQTKPSVILISPEVSIRQLAESALEQLKSTHVDGTIPELIYMPTFGELYESGTSFTPLPPYKRNLDTPRIILHSSGKRLFEYSASSNSDDTSQVQLLYRSQFLGMIALCYRS